MPRQAAIKEIVSEVDGPELSDIELVARFIDLGHEKKRVADAHKKTGETLAQRLADRGVTEVEIGENRVIIGPKMLTEYDQGTLGSLRPNCLTDDQIWLTVKQLPSGKQLKALSDLGGASAKAVIASAKRKIETDVIQVKIKKPKKAGRARRDD